MLKEGDRAPDFTLPDQDKNPVSLSGFKGKKVVVYFYPKDDTPGCTTEACSFRDANDLYLAKGAVVLGISADDAESHQQFRKKYNLPFHLLSDPDHKTIEEYGAWGEKNLYGKISHGIIRSTFIVDEKGIIIKAYPKVKPEFHAQDVLMYL
jgi:thioredoxin-dependent peroxiredoxin